MLIESVENWRANKGANFHFSISHSSARDNGKSLSNELQCNWRSLIISRCFMFALPSDDIYKLSRARRQPRPATTSPFE